MKTNIKINVLTEEITMTKATFKKASFVGTQEYEQLVKAKRDFPSFAVKILSPKVNKNTNKGLTMELMNKLIWIMANDDIKAIERFEEVKKSYAETNFHFSKPKAYFLSQYPTWRKWLPQVEEKQSNIN